MKKKPKMNPRDAYVEAGDTATAIVGFSKKKTAELAKKSIIHSLKKKKK